jgi:hypothetical protein
VKKSGEKKMNNFYKNLLSYAKLRPLNIYLFAKMQSCYGIKADNKNIEW